MKKQSKLNRFVDVTARVIIGLLLCAVWIFVCVKTPTWILFILLVLDSPLYSKHGFVERALRALIYKELIPCEESRPRDFVMVIREKDIKPETEEK